MRIGTRDAHAPATSLVTALAILVAASVPGAASAQGVRGWVGSSVQMLEMRPLAMDTIPVELTSTDAEGRTVYEGNVVECTLVDACLGYRALEEARTVAVSQDLSLTAWGFGVRGLSFTTLLRTRQRGGSDVVWPRSDDAFDALIAYAQLVRGRLQVRLGRQEIRSGLGFPAFDGASVGWSMERVHVEAYGGRSLARGLRDPANEALRGLEDFVPDQSVVILGASARARFYATSMTGRYQREIFWDRSGLESERASVDFTTYFPRLRVTGALDYDFAFEQVGKGNLTLSAPFDGNRWLVEATAKRYLPYFSLSTIWGFFEPVSYHEAQLRVAWAPTASLGAWVSGAWREYGDANTEVILRPLENVGKRAGAGLRWEPAPTWAVQGSYQLEWGPGSTLNSADASVRWTPSERVSLALNAMSFQQFEEFRLGEGRAWGAGLSADARLTERASLGGGLSVLRHDDRGGSVTSPWDQTRAWSSLRILVGDDPGLRGRSR